MPLLSTGHVFISYSRKDTEAMLRIVSFLRGQGIKAWVDNENLVPGTPIWEREIEKAIDKAYAVVVVLSPDAKESVWVLNELTLADEYKKRVFPVLVRGDFRESVHFRLVSRQLVDLRANEESGLESLSVALGRYLDELKQLEEERQAAERETEQQKQAEFARIAAQKAEEERAAKAEREAERFAKEKAEAERLAAQKAEEERLAKVKLEEKRLAEEKRRAENKANAEKKAREEADHLAAQKSEQARTKAITEEKQREREKPEAQQPAKPSAGPSQVGKESIPIRSLPFSLPKIQFTQPMIRWAIIGFVGLCLLGGGIWGISSMLRAFNPTPTEEQATEEPVATEAPAQSESSENVQIRWFVGLGTGSSPDQVAVEQAIVDDFNNSQDKITVTLEVVEFEQAVDTLATELASGNVYDIVGPMGWEASHKFYRQWLDLSPYISQYDFDTSAFQPELVDHYRTDEGQVSLPFAAYPSAVFYVPRMFDEAGLSYPPSTYGEPYMLDGSAVDWDWNTLAEVSRRLTIDVDGRNAADSGFDRDQIVQYGFGFQWLDSIQYISTYRAGAATIVQDNQSILPISWKDAMGWYQDAIWGNQPFIATGNWQNTVDFNIFDSGKEAMTIVPAWYLCCITNIVQNGDEFQIAVLPLGDDGQVHGRIEADSFRIWKDSQHPEEAFEFLVYLLTTGSDQLLSIYNAMSAIPNNNGAYFERHSADYPFVTSESWNVLVQNLAYPDNPSALQYQPNYSDAVARMSDFTSMLKNSPPSQIDFDTEWAQLVEDLNSIYQR